MGRMTRRDFIRGVVAAGSAGALSAIGSKAPAQPKGLTLRAMSYPYPVTNAIRDMLPMYDEKTKKWSYSTGEGRKLDRARFEEWKTNFYKFEGFNTANGWPTRKTLEAMGLKKVADVMQGKGKLG